MRARDAGHLCGSRLSTRLRPLLELANQRLRALWPVADNDDGQIIILTFSEVGVLADGSCSFLEVVQLGSGLGKVWSEGQVASSSPTG